MKRIQIATCALLALVLSSCSENGKLGSGGSTDLKTQIDSVSYGIGVSIGSSFKKDGLDSIVNLDVMIAAMRTAMKGDSLKLNMMAAQQCIQGYFMQKAQEKGKAAMDKGLKFLEENKKRAGVVTLPSGLQYEVMKEGNGPKPTLTDKVTTHYHGTLLNGTIFDSSVDRKEPAQFGVSQVIPGWTEALQLMAVGSKWKLFVPANLAYGERGGGEKIGPNETLIFEIELLSIDKNTEKEGPQNPSIRMK
jgi:FKBP-type peptidyl-prolyl cis-trans isomerase FklB